MAKFRRSDEIPELPRELREYNPDDGWLDRREWSRARAAEMFRLGIRRLPGLQRMCRPDGGAES